MSRLDVALDSGSLLFPDQGPEDRRWVPGITDLDQRRYRRHPFLVSVQEVLGKKEPGLQHTTLAAVHQHGTEADRAGVLLIHIAQDHLGALAAEFQLQA